MNGIVSRFTTFDKLIATTLIKIFYWIGIAAIVFGMLAVVVGGFSNGFLGGVGALILAPVGGAIAIIVWRFMCEVYIVIFGMYDRLGQINDKLAARP